MTTWKRKEIIGDCTLYLGDCEQIMPELGTFDAVVTDPPYGIGITKSNRISISRGMCSTSWDDRPAKQEIINNILLCSKLQIIWGGNYFKLPPTRAPLAWDKNNSGRDFADFEMAWTNLNMVARRFVMRPYEYGWRKNPSYAKTNKTYGMVFNTHTRRKNHI